MTNEEFVQFRAQFNMDCETTLGTKGEAYTQNSTDRHKNFKANAERWGLTPLQVWAIYFGKHLDSIQHYIKNGKEGPEGVRGNFMDARNYLDLGLSLIEELNPQKEVRTPISKDQRIQIHRRQANYRGKHGYFTPPCDRRTFTKSGRRKIDTPETHYKHLPRL